MFIHQGTLPKDKEILTRLVNSRPFIHQIDLVLTDNGQGAGDVSRLNTSYFKIKITFSTLFEIFASSSVGTMIISIGNSEAEDVWCLDSSGILALSLTNSTYERLGIPGGSQISTSGNKISFLVKLDLRDTSSSLAKRSRERLAQWDSQRAHNGEGLWEALLCTESSSLIGLSAGLGIKLTIDPECRTTSHAYVPASNFPVTGINKSDEAGVMTAELFEWLGLACLGSQCLDVAATVNPYVASYDPPQGSESGTIHHYRWTGFMSPTIVNDILNTILLRSKGVKGISVLTFDSLLPRISPTGSAKSRKDVWSLIASEQAQNSQDETICWLLAERR